MANERFQELLQKMPAIANAVNSFSSESIQQAAYDDLLTAFNDSQPSDSDSPGDDSAEATRTNGGGAVSTADILAMARGEKPVAKTPARAPKKQDAEPEKRSDVEVIKEESHQLRGAIPEELKDGNDFFGKESLQLLKHHGTYQQDDRDARTLARKEGRSGKSYIFMVRTKIPGGKLTSSQLLTEFDLCDELGNDTLRITSRQGLQLHGVVKSNLKESIQRIHEAQLSTLGACGDLNRNVMACPGPYANAINLQVQALADEIAEHLAPKTPAYHEIWLKEEGSDEKELIAGGVNGAEIEPIYGKVYMPRKFKIGIGFPHDNCIDIYTHDLGLMAVVRDDAIVGYNILVGGGQGTTPSMAKTFPALGKRMAFVPPEQVVDVATAVVKVQRDFGNRADRKRARLKYLVHDWGIEKFKAKTEEYLGQKIADPEPEDVSGHNDHMGWEKQGDGKWFYGLNIENGRIADTDQWQMKTAIREICNDLNPGIRLTAHQSMLFTDISGRSKKKLESILKKHSVPLTVETSIVRRWSMACVAWPTCGLSITESERALPGFMDDLEVELAKLGLSEEPFTVRMTGCPNGCARPYNSDVGLVGCAKDHYTMFLGGRLLGNRLSFEYKKSVAHNDVVPELAKVLTYFKQDREKSETFGDFCERKGKDDLLQWTENYQP